jgi:hypothetical protein
MVPSHASKAGRRYRYYISKPTSGNSTESRWRLPAPMIEEVVLNGIVAFLRNKLRLTEALHLTGERMKGMLFEAADLSNRIREAGPAEQRAVLLDVVQHIELRRDRVRIVLRTQSLSAVLSHGDPGGGQAKTDTPGSNELKLNIPVAFKRRGVETKLVITDERERPPAPDPKLILAISQGRQWFTKIKHSNVRSVRALAKTHNVDQGDVSRVIPFALLAPDIIEAILAGRQPVELTVSRLKRIGDLPVSWVEQRQLLGFA